MTVLERKIRWATKRYKSIIPMIVKHSEDFARIPVFADPKDHSQPYWYNGMLPGLDAAALYTFLADMKPAYYIEIGSGHSTRFAAKAIVRHSPETRIVSIDPNPAIDVDGLCHEVFRSRLQDVPTEVFARLTDNDILFFDGSHVSHMHSDVTRFFLDILPALGRGVLVQIHDIFLPDDYPSEFGIDRGYNEQYLLAAYLLGGGNRVKLFFPCHYVTQCEWGQPLQDAWKGIHPHWTPEAPGFEPWGGSFWLRTT